MTSLRTYEDDGIKYNFLSDRYSLSQLWHLIFHIHINLTQSLILDLSSLTLKKFDRIIIDRCTRELYNTFKDHKLRRSRVSIDYLENELFKVKMAWFHPNKMCSKLKGIFEIPFNYSKGKSSNNRLFLKPYENVFKTLLDLCYV